MSTDSKQLAHLKQLAQHMGLVGLLEHWDELPEQTAERLVQWESDARTARSLGRRIAAAHLGRFKALADFDWSWPKPGSREAIDELLGLDFVRVGTNAVFVGANGTGKTMLAKNLVHKAVMAGFSARFVAASDMLAELAQATPQNRQRRLRRYTQPDLLAIDEVGYLSYDNRYADLLYEVVNARYQRKSTMVTTNLPFSQWPAVFPSATCVVTLVDRLTHHAEIVQIVADSYRQHEAKAERQQRADKREERKRRA